MNTVTIINNSGKSKKDFLDDVRKTFNNAGAMKINSNTIAVLHKTYSGIYSYTGTVFARIDKTGEDIK